MGKIIVHNGVTKTLLAVSICLILIVLFSITYADKAINPHLFINLQEYPLYLKQGFELSTIVEPNTEDGTWLEKKPFSNVIVGWSGLPEIPRRSFLSPFGLPEKEFTFVIPFTCQTNNLPQSFTPGLFLAGIGDNWEIFLNGILIKTEMHVAYDSLRITKHHSQRDVFFPFSAELIRQGDNLLGFRIVGDPGDQTVGFQYSAPYYIADYEFIRQQNNETMALLFVGGYLMAGVYHLLLFAIRRRDIHYFYCGIFASLMGFYYLFRTHGIYDYITDTVLVVKMEFFCIFLVIPALGAFADSLCRGRVSGVIRVYGLGSVFLAVSQLVLPRPYGSDCLVLFQVAGLIALMYIVACILHAFLGEIKKERKHYELDGRRPPGIPYFLAETYAGNLLIAICIMTPTAMIDILDSLIFHYSLNITKYCFYCFILTITLMLARIYGRLNNALQAKSMFLANMSHEIRTPMNTVLGMTEQILRSNPPETVREKARDIKKAGTTLVSIINDILDFSRIEAGKMRLVNREYHFHSLMQEVTETARFELAGSEVRFHVEIDPDIPQILVGDALRIRQVLSNILGNAVKYTKKGNISFSAMLLEQGDRPLIKFSVTDSGVGIRPEDEESIFTEFHRLERRNRGGAEGTGLGLAICRNLCRLMGSEIGMKSEYGKGSVFTVILPQRYASGSVITEPEERRTLFEMGVTMPTVRVLVVDDIPANCRVLAGHLRAYGMEFHAAGSGKEAVERARLQSYDLVFMDHIMGDDMNGVAVVAALRELDGFSSIPIIACTAHAVTGMREFFIDHDFQDFLTKPIDLHELDAVIDKWVPVEKRFWRASELPVEDSSLAISSGSPDLLEVEIGMQQINLLRHYYWHLISITGDEKEYCGKTADLLETLLETVSGTSVEMTLAIQQLIECGRRADIVPIKNGLQEVCTSLTTLLQKSGETEKIHILLNGSMTLSTLISRLHDALEANDTRRADELMAELQVLSRPNAMGLEMRELYFFLYDALMMGEMQKAAGALELWKRMY